jgi:hypothetical protein
MHVGTLVSGTVGKSEPYMRLRPNDATPHHEICQCVLKWSIMLLSRLSDNPLVCAMCRGEVEPSKLPMPTFMVDKVLTALGKLIFATVVG